MKWLLIARRDSLTPYYPPYSFLKTASGSAETILEILNILKAPISASLKLSSSKAKHLNFDCGPKQQAKLYISLKILKVCFVKSSMYREEIVNLGSMLQTLLDLACALIALIEPRQTCLGLENEMKILELACHLLSAWTTDSFTRSYPKLMVFRDQVAKTNILASLVAIKKRFDSADPTLTAAQLAKIEKSNAIRLEKYLASLQQWPSMRNYISEHQIQLETLLDIIYPARKENRDDEPDDMFEMALADSRSIPGNDTQIHDVEYDSKQKDLLLHPPGFSMTISLDATRVRDVERLDSLGLDVDAAKRIVESEDNAVVFQQIREHRQVLLSMQSNLTDLLSLATKVLDSDTNRLETFLKQLIDAKRGVKNVLEKSRIMLDNAQNDSEDEEVFEEVDDSFQMTSSSTAMKRESKFDNSKVIPVYSFTGLKPVYSSTADSVNVNNEDNNEDASQKMKDLDTKPGPSKRNPLFDQAPIVEWQPDLDHWSSKRVTFADISSHSGLEFKHRFLGEATEASYDKEVGTQVMDKLRKRLIVVDDEINVDDSKRVQYPICGVKLKNGSLCQRRDQEKCPFHGIIRPRGQDGELLEGVEEVPRQQIWQEIEQDVLATNFLQTNQHHRGRRTSASRAAVSQAPKDSVRTRILRKSKRISSRAARSGISDGSKLVQELVTRDRQVFRW